MDDCPKTEQSPARSGDAPQQPLAERKPEPFISIARVDHILKEARRPIAKEMGVGVGTIHRMAQRRSKKPLRGYSLARNQNGSAQERLGVLRGPIVRPRRKECGRATGPSFSEPP